MPRNFGHQLVHSKKVGMPIIAKTKASYWKFLETNKGGSPCAAFQNKEDLLPHIDTKLNENIIFLP
jgi:hypothetical protein